MPTKHHYPGPPPELIANVGVVEQRAELPDPGLGLKHDLVSRREGRCLGNDDGRTIPGYRHVGDNAGERRRDARRERLGPRRSTMGLGPIGWDLGMRRLTRGPERRERHKDCGIERGGPPGTDIDGPETAA